MEILIEDMDGGLWVAATHNGKLEDLEVDPAHEEVRWGSIYWGKVEKIDKAQDAAYVRLDVDNMGILYNADIRITDSKGNIHKGGAQAIGKSLRPGQMIAVQAKSAYVPSATPEDDRDEDKIVKLSMDITLPGRYLVYAPMMQNNRVSNRIRDKKLRRTLNKMIDSIDNIKGCILRASAANTQTDILVREAKILKSIWDQLDQYFEGDDVQLIMLGPDAIQRTLSDAALHLVSTIEIVTMEQYENAEEWCEVYAPDLVTKISPIEMDNPYADLALFDYRNIMEEIESLFHPYTKLEDGANLIIEETAALIAIDVNRGAHKGSNIDINIQAVREIGRQLRLRNLGGIVLIDFLKMSNKKDEGILLAEAEKVFADDPCTIQIHGITALGLLEITRKRRTPPLKDFVPEALIF